MLSVVCISHRVSGASELWGKKVPFHFAGIRALNGQMCVSGAGGNWPSLWPSALGLGGDGEGKEKGLGSTAQPSHILVACLPPG